MSLDRRSFLGTAAALATTAALPAHAHAADAAVIDARVNLALQELYKQYPGSKELATKAKAILVMPDVIKGGFIVGGSYGEGALRMNDPTHAFEKTEEYYSVAAASVGFQAGLQETSHALFFLTDSALSTFRRKDGWEVGADAEVTFPDAGVNIGTNSSVLNQPVIGFVFGEDGVLVGASLEGAKYSRIVR
ncbi:MAG: YSC84-related protein [Pseudomonadota bacterium]